ncbi:hypothetical protein JOL62DRAFT_621618 [Phyllosticta paracitricarpa]|uniref:Uncharacterized protein n=1 Tax=Phyllosticta paracitricarpa TaxID=2016321 RepID=A0ABR1N4R1_9PEZI
MTVEEGWPLLLILSLCVILCLHSPTIAPPFSFVLQGELLRFHLLERLRPLMIKKSTSLAVSMMGRLLTHPLQLSNKLYFDCAWHFDTLEPAYADVHRLERERRKRISIIYVVHPSPWNDSRPCFNMLGCRMVMHYASHRRNVLEPCDSTSTYHSTRTVTISSTITNHFPLFSPTSYWSIDSSVSGGIGTPKYTNSYPPPTSSSTPWTISSSVSAGSSCPAVSLATLTVTPYSCVATPTSTVYFSVTSTIVEEITATRVIGTPPPPGTVTLTTTRYYGTPAPPSIITVTKVNTSILTTPPTTVTRESTVFDTTTLTVRFPFTVHTTTTSTTAALWPTPPLCTPCGASSRDATTVLTETVYTSTTTTLPTPSPPSSSTPGSTVSSVEGVTSTPTLNPTSEVGPPFGTWSTTRPSYGPPTYAASPEPVFSVVRGEEGWERKVVE